MLPVFFITDLLDTVGDISFVIKVMGFAYVLFWLYITFQESQILFGLSSIGLGYLLLFHSPWFVSLAAAVFLMMAGGQLQMSIQFGLFPFLQHHSMESQQREQELMQKRQGELQENAERGSISQEETREYQENEARAQIQQGPEGREIDAAMVNINKQRRFAGR